MIIGIPKEIKRQEGRVSLTPAAVRQLKRYPHEILVEKEAGVGSGFSDHAYSEAGALIVNEHGEVFERAELIVKVKEPLPEEYNLIRSHHILFTYLHLAANRPLTDALLHSGARCVAYETVEVKGRLPLLEPMSEIAGRMSVIVGGFLLGKHHGGNGVLLGGVPGVLPGKVVVLGGGTSGINAARMALGLGADVTILEVDHERMRFLDLSLQSSNTLFSSEASLTDLLPATDLLIGAVLVPGAKAPRLVNRAMLRLMKPGSVVVDIAVDQGGCIETTRPTTHADPTYVEEQILHYCVANMPGAYARTATQALTNVTFRYVEEIANHGLEKACERNSGLEMGINIANGELKLAAIAAESSGVFTRQRNGAAAVPMTK